MLFHLLTMNRHLMPLRNSCSKTDRSTPGEKKNQPGKFVFTLWLFLLFCNSLFVFPLYDMDNFLHVPSVQFLFRLLRILDCKMRKWHLRKVCGKKKSQHLPVFKQNCLQETDLKGSRWHISYVVEKTDIISNAFEYLMQRKGLKVSLSSTRVFHECCKMGSYILNNQPWVVLWSFNLMSGYDAPLYHLPHFS